MPKPDDPIEPRASVLVIVMGLRILSSFVIRISSFASSVPTRGASDDQVAAEDHRRRRRVAGRPGARQRRGPAPGRPLGGAGAAGADRRVHRPEAAEEPAEHPDGPAHRPGDDADLDPRAARRRAGRAVSAGRLHGREAAGRGAAVRPLAEHAAPGRARSRGMPGGEGRPGRRLPDPRRPGRRRGAQGPRTASAGPSWRRPRCRPRRPR